VLVLDTLLFGGLKFVLNRIVEAVDAELNDETLLREELLAAQMRFELGEMSQDEFAQFERDILARLREIRERQMAEAPLPRDTRVTGVEATVWSDETESDEDDDRR
jgi:hypothetical protein